MVDKIDRPNPPEPWTITATAQTKDRGQRQGQPSREGEHDDEYSAPGSSDRRWQKLSTQGDVRRIITVERSDIRHLWFRKAVMQRQSVLVECDLEMASGTLYSGAQFLLPRLEDYLQFKGYIPGQEVPVTGFIHDLVTEVSVPATRPAPATRTATPPPVRAVSPPPPLTAWWALWDATTHQLRPLAIVLYSLTALLLMGMILLLV